MFRKLYWLLNLFWKSLVPSWCLSIVTFVNQVDEADLIKPIAWIMVGLYWVNIYVLYFLNSYFRLWYFAPGNLVFLVNTPIFQVWGIPISMYLSIYLCLSLGVLSILSFKSIWDQYLALYLEFFLEDRNLAMILSLLPSLRHIWWQPNSSVW